MVKPKMAKKNNAPNKIIIASHPSPPRALGWGPQWLSRGRGRGMVSRGRGLLAVTILLILSTLTQAQSLYSAAYGNPTDPAIVFLHGGPDYDAVNFEVTTAEPLAARGYYVIVYDRRGEGRSAATVAGYTFTQSVADIDSLLEVYHVASVTLLGHSFGGMLGTVYAEQYPERVNALVLVAAPVNVQPLLKNVFNQSTELYTAANDTVNLAYMAQIEQMDTAGAEYSGYLLAHALLNGFYTTEIPTSEAVALYTDVETRRKEQARVLNWAAPASAGFIEHEHFTTLDLTGRIQDLIDGGLEVYGIYGMEDGLFSLPELKRIEALLGADHFQRIGSASHNVFIDQQPTFLTLVAQWAKQE